MILGIDHTYKGSRYSPQPCRLRHAVTGEVAPENYARAHPHFRSRV